MTDMLTRALGKASSFNAEARTVDLVFASETPVRRRGYDGAFDEVLVISRQAIDASRLENMTLLDGHDAYSGLDSRLGSVVPGSLHFEGTKAIVTVKISRNAKGDQLVRDLEDDQSLPVSVGYRIDTHERRDAPPGGVATVRATRWTPLEISIVSIPADAAARTRSLQRNPEMENFNNPQQPQSQQVIAPSEAREAEIRGLARIAGLPDDSPMVRRALLEGQDVESFRTALLEHLVDESERSPTFPVSSMRGMTDERDKMRTMVSNALAHRIGVTGKLEEGAREYRSMTVLDIMRDLQVRTGGNSRGSSHDIIERSLHTTSDFPIILNNVVNMTMMEAYTQHQQTFRLIANRNTVRDLREVKVVELGEAPQLEKLTERGEYKRGTVRESEESFTMGHWGKVIGFSETMIINDHLEAFAKLIAGWTKMVARLEGNIVWDQIISNAKLKSDGKALFHNDHGNLGTAAALSKDNLIAGRKMFRKQTDIDGNPIDIAPKFLFVGSDNEVTAQTLTQATTMPQTTDQVVPEAIRSLVPVYEPRIDKLSEKAWFLFADVNETMGRGLQYAYLSGFETPRLKERWGFDYDGVEYRLDHYFGAGLTDYRFAYKNPGQ